MSYTGRSCASSRSTTYAKHTGENFDEALRFRSQPDDATDRARMIWIVDLRRANDLEAVDRHAVVSDRMMASKLIRRASHFPGERSHVLFNCGARSCTIWRRERDKQYHQPSRQAVKFAHNAHSGMAHFPHTRTFLSSCTPQDCAIYFKHCLRVKNRVSVGITNRTNHLHDVTRAPHRQPDGPQRAHLRRRPGQPCLRTLAQ